MNPSMLLQQWWQQFDPVIFFTFLFAILYLFKFSRSWNRNLPPSPPKLPIIGNIHQVGKLPHRSFRALSEKYGPLMLLHMGQTPTLVVSSAELGREVIVEHDVFVERPQIRVTHTLFCGCTDIAFSSYGDYWRQAKKICVVELLSQRRVKMFQLVREQEVSRMIENITECCHNGSEIAACEMFETIANNIISRSVLGQVYEREHGNKGFGELSRKAMDLIGSFCFEDFFPYLGWVDALTGLTSELEKVSSELHAFIDQIIEDRLVMMNDGDNYTSDNKSFVDILLHLQLDGKLDISLTQDNLRAILLDMFIGGTDNIAATLEWAMAELMKNPDIMKKAQEEVRTVVGRKPSVIGMDVNEMHYLKCVVKETLRLHAPVMVSRQNPTATKLAGYDIPAKTIVLVNTWAIQRDPKLWDKAEEFIPDRFLNSSVEFKGQHIEFMPFGAGRRGCPGITFAVAGAEYVLANLLYWFDWELPDSQRCEDLDMSDYYALVVRKKVPLRLVPVLHSFSKTCNPFVCSSGS
ncbi:cytochrome P450 71A1-like [Hibiscus syriacus]|uniref:cytochrome P450 71A1-like n=1 Tax=Hibiscus syriacus TaxID=106335 RepID=UPI001921B23D|nr:cytochrome P450 71A1-like [Hibiscus syriacus]